MLRLLGCTSLFLALLIAGCANPADDKFKVTATEPKAVEPAAPTNSATDGAAPPTVASLPAAPSATTTAPTVASGSALVITPEASKIDFIGSKVTGSHNGGFKKFSGTVELVADKPEVKQITVDIDMDSLWADNDKLTTHLKTADFFDVPKNPKSTFVTTEIKPGGEKGASHTITGNLTLHGVTKSITFPATLTVKDDAVTLTSEFVLNRREFGINLAGQPNNLIRDEVVIKLDVKAAKKA